MKCAHTMMSECTANTCKCFPFLSFFRCGARNPDSWRCSWLTTVSSRRTWRIRRHTAISCSTSSLPTKKKWRKGLLQNFIMLFEFYSNYSPIIQILFRKTMQNISHFHRMSVKPEYNQDTAMTAVNEEPSNVCDYSWNYSLQESNNSLKSEGFGESCAMVCSFLVDFILVSLLLRIF